MVNFRLMGDSFPNGIRELPICYPGRSCATTPVSEQPIAGPALALLKNLLTNGREGQVGVRCVVTVQGTTRNCLLVKSTGDRDIEAAAIDFLSRARFTPATLDGAPIEVSHAWTLRYGDK
jgi:TonB family protein